MIRLMKTVTLIRAVEQSQNEFGAIVNSVEQLPIQMAISNLTGSSQEYQNIKTVDSTHIGITQYTNITTKDEIMDNSATYTVDYVIQGGRCTQVFLKLVV